MSTKRGHEDSIWGFGLVSAIMFLVGLFFWAKALVDSNAAKNWPSIDGIVIGSVVGENIDLEGDVLYTAVVTYQYSVNGSSYVSHRITPGSDYYESSGTAKVKADQYPEGMIVKVYYDPNAPDKAMLEPEGFLGYGLGMMLFGGVIFAVIWIGSLIRKSKYVSSAKQTLDEGDELDTSDYTEILKKRLSEIGYDEEEPN